jgi:hypothetical protein
MLKHLTDDEVQLYVDDKKQCGIEITQHINSCEICKARLETYQLLIKGIKQQPQYSFDFDLSESVLQQLPQQSIKTSNDRSLSWIFISIGIALVAGVSIYFSEYMSALFKNFGTTILIYLLIVSAVTIIAVLFLDLYKKYNHQIKLFDTY